MTEIIISKKHRKRTRAVKVTDATKATDIAKVTDAAKASGTAKVKFAAVVITFLTFLLSNTTILAANTVDVRTPASQTSNSPSNSSTSIDTSTSSTSISPGTSINPNTSNTPGNDDISVGPQYDTTHIYVAPEDFDHFVSSFIATFGGTTSKQGVFQVTPTPSRTMSQLALTPVGTISIFGFKTPIPFPFGLERTGYLVTDLDKAVEAARLAGADVIVAPFPDPIGRDAIIQWPGSINMQLYWHTSKPSYEPLKTVPENRVYVSKDRADMFIQSYLKFSKGKIVSDEAQAPGIEIGRKGDTYRRVQIESGFGKMLVMVTDGHLPWPFGREITGYEVTDFKATQAKAIAAGVFTLVEPFASNNRISTIVQFPGGYIAEFHANLTNSKNENSE